MAAVVAVAMAAAAAAGEVRKTEKNSSGNAYILHLPRCRQ